MSDGAKDELGVEFDWRWADEEGAWVPPTIDVSIPSVARMYDYYLGGKDNFAVDREAAERVLEAAPDSRFVAQANRGFLGAAVQAMVDAGVRQFIDLGTGIPTAPNVHQLAGGAGAQARVVYVDNDPVVLTHSRALLATDPAVACVQHDLRQPSEVLDDPAVRRLIDFDQPVGLLFVAVLHFVRHDLASEIIAQYGNKLVPGSHIAISTACSEGIDPERVARIESEYASSSAPIVFRTRVQIEELFEGFELLEPGLTTLARWRTDQGSGGLGALCGVGRKL